jgi:hypothetical protein
MSSKTATKKATKAVVATEPVKEEVVIEPIKEEPTLDPVKDNEELANIEEQSEEKKDEVEEIISAEEHLNLLKERIENTKRLIKAQKSITQHTKVELKEIQKEEKLLNKTEFQLSEERNKVLHSIASSSAPKPQKNKVDADGNKIPTPGKNPVVWYDFVRDAFELETNNGFSSKYLELMWPFLKSEEGVKEGASLIISKPGKVNTFFNNIKSVIEKRGLTTEKDKKNLALIEKGVLKNTDIFSFSTYCYDEKEKKVKVSKKAAKAEAEAK